MPTDEADDCVRSLRVFAFLLAEAADSEDDEERGRLLDAARTWDTITRLESRGIDVRMDGACVRVLRYMTAAVCILVST